MRHYLNFEEKLKPLEMRIAEIGRFYDINDPYYAKEVESLRKRLLGVSPQGVLKRGYAIVRKDGVPVTRSQQLARNDEASVEFQDGKVMTKVQ